jgi:hypothetical protein
VLKTEQLINEKVTLIKEMSNQLFVLYIINFLQLLSFQLCEHLTALFYVKSFTSLIKDVGCIYIRILQLTFISATGIVQGLYRLGTVILHA